MAGEVADFVARLRLNIEDNGELRNYVRAALNDIKSLAAAAGSIGAPGARTPNAAADYLRKLAPTAAPGAQDLVAQVGNRLRNTNEFKALSPRGQQEANQAIKAAQDRFARTILQNAQKWSTLSPERQEAAVMSAISGHLKTLRAEILNVTHGFEAAQAFARRISVAEKEAADASRGLAAAAKQSERAEKLRARELERAANRARRAGVTLSSTEEAALKGRDPRGRFISEAGRGEVALGIRAKTLAAERLEAERARILALEIQLRGDKALAGSIQAEVAAENDIVALRQRRRALEREMSTAIRGGGAGGGGGGPLGPGGPVQGGGWFDRARSQITGQASNTGGALRYLGQAGLTTARYGITGAAFYGGIAGMRELIREAEDLDKIMNQIRRQFDEVGDEDFGTARSSILSIARETGRATDEVATVFFQFRGAFGETGKALRETNEAIKLTRVTGLELKEVVDSLTATSLTYGVSIEQIGDNALGLQERFGVLANQTITFTADLAATAKQAGLTYEELAALGAIAQQTSGKGGASLAEGFGRILPGIGERQGEILGLFSSVGALQSRFQTVAEAFSGGQTGVVLKELVRGFNDLTRAEQNQAIATLGGRREAQDLIPVLANSAKLVREWDDAANGVADSGKLNNYFEDLQGTVQQTFSRVREIFTQLGDSLFRSGLADFLVDTAGGLALFLKVIDSGLRILAALNEATGGLLGQIIALPLVLKLASVAYRGLISLFVQEQLQTIQNVETKGAEVTARNANTLAIGRETVAKQRLMAASVGEANTALRNAVIGRTPVSNPALAAYGLPTTLGQPGGGRVDPFGVGARVGGFFSGIPAAYGAAGGGFAGLGAAVSAAMPVVLPAMLIGGAFAFSKFASVKADASADNDSERERFRGMSDAQLATAEVDARSKGLADIMDHLTGRLEEADIRAGELFRRSPEGQQGLYITQNLTDKQLDEMIGRLSRSNIDALAGQAGLQFGGVKPGQIPIAGSSQRGLAQRLAGILHLPGGGVRTEKTGFRREGLEEAFDLEDLQKLYDDAQNGVEGALDRYRAVIRILTDGDEANAALIEEVLKSSRANDLDAQATDFSTQQQLYEANVITAAAFKSYLDRQVKAFEDIPKPNNEQKLLLAQYRNALQQLLIAPIQATFERFNSIVGVGGQADPATALRRNLAQLHRLRVANRGQSTASEAELSLIPEIITNFYDNLLNGANVLLESQADIDAAYAKGSRDLAGPQFLGVRRSFNQAAVHDSQSAQRIFDRLNDAGVTDDNVEAQVIEEMSQANVSFEEALKRILQRKIAILRAAGINDPEIQRAIALYNSLLTQAEGNDVQGFDEVQKEINKQKDIEQNDQASSRRQATVNRRYAGRNLTGPQEARRNQELAREARDTALRRYAISGNYEDLTAVYEAQNDLDDADNEVANAIADYDQRLAEAYANLGVAQANGDPVRVAQAQLAAAQQAYASAIERFGANSPEAVQAQAALINAQNALSDAYDDIGAAAIELRAAQVGRDPVRSAQVAIEAANHAIATAKGSAAALRAQAQLVKAQQQLAQANFDVIMAFVEQSIAIAQIQGDAVAVADLELKQAQARLQEVLDDPNAGVAERVRAETDVMLKTAGAKDARLQKRLDDIDFLLEMEQITTGQAIAMLQSVLDSGLADNEGEVRDIQRRIKQLKDNLSQDLQFNLPSDIALPTLYEARRLNQTPGGAGYQDNRVITITLSTSSAKEAEIAADRIVTEINAPPRNGTYGKRY